MATSGVSLAIFQNQQPAEKQELRGDGVLDVVDLPWKTLQGEGPFSGRPAIFLRLAGCNLSSLCHFCDTNYTEGRKLYPKEELFEKILELKAPTNLVVITGGEPFRQNLTPLVHVLLNNNFEVQIETNGTLFLENFPYSHAKVHLVCSPKTGSINNLLKPHIRHLKYIVEAGKIDPLDGLPLDSLGAGIRVARPWDSFLSSGGRVYIQPLDEQNPQKNNLHALAAADSCLKWGYTLSMQLHKLLDLK